MGAVQHQNQARDRSVFEGVQKNRYSGFLDALSQVPSVVVVELLKPWANPRRAASATERRRKVNARFTKPATCRIQTTQEEFQMSDLKTYAEITDEDVKKVYDSSPSVNETTTWQEVKSYLPLYLSLKNQVPHRAPVHAITVVREDLPESSRLFIGFDAARPINPQRPRLVKTDTPKKKNVLVLTPGKVQQLIGTLSLAVTCLQCAGISDAVKSEALAGLREQSKSLNDFIKQKSV